jgi:feruloyl esterase
MRQVLKLIVLAAGIASAGSVAAQPAPAPADASTAACRGVMAQNFSALPDAVTAIQSATVVAPAGDLPEYCRVQGFVSPRVSFEVRLPTKTWNGRFLMQGCGGMCGILNMEATEDSLVRGYAVVNTDMGHKGESFIATWAYNDIQAEIDFGYRATHVVAVAAKAIINAYYGKPASYSYFNGCSTGGRQGAVAAQRFPDDFDGIVSGAPVLNEIGDGILHLLWSARANMDAKGNPIMDSRKLAVVRKAVMAKCDKLDGVEDNILQDPRKCDFKVEDLKCSGTAKADCLSADEVGVMKKIYGGATDSKGSRIFPGGMALGSEYEWAPAFIGLTKADGAKANGGIVTPNTMIYQFAQYLAFFNDPGHAYNPLTYDWDQDPARLMLTESLYNAQNPDLRKFKASGGKMIMYHGWDDLEVPPNMSVDYYETTTRTMGGLETTRDFFRLYMMPSVAHCRRGPGPDGIDTQTAIENWVEKGIAPDFILAHKMAKDQPYSGLPRLRFPLKPGEALWARPVYAYPDVATYKGEGDWKDPANWAAARP